MMAQKRKTNYIHMKKTESKKYFTKQTQESIVEYCETDSRDEKERLYIDSIKPAFDELIEKIVFTYNFGHLADLDGLKHECKLYLISILSNFDPEKGSKAFSYFTIVTKNWFSYKCKKQNKKKYTEVQIEEVTKDYHNEKTITYNKYIQTREEYELWMNLLQNFDVWKRYYKGNDLKVLYSIETLFNNIENIEIFNKKAVYLYMREITGLNTKQITNSLKKIRQKYHEFKKSWNEGKI